MHIGVLFYSDTLVMAQGMSTARGISGIKGRAVANNDFVRALLQYRGDARVTIFLSSPVERDLFQEHYSGCLDDPGIRVVTLYEAQTSLEKQPLDVLHVLGPDLYRGFYFRSHIARAMFPVTGVTHTLSHAPFEEWLLISLLHHPQVFDRLICTTPTAAEVVRKMLEARPPELAGTDLKTQIIPLGVFPPSVASQDGSVRHRIGIPDSATILLSLSRLSCYTKADLLPLLLAFRGIARKASQDVRLVIAGATGQEHYPELLQAVIRELALEDRVVLLPDPDDQLKNSLYQAADIFVALSDNLQETFGLTLVEALVSGLPVVASDWDGYRSLIQEGKNGFLIPTTGPKEIPSLESIAPLQLDSLVQLSFSQAVATDLGVLSGRILALIENSSLRKGFAEAARKYSKRFQWESVIQDYVSLWAQLSQNSRQSTTHQASLRAGILDYHQVFSHYSTHLLTDDAVCSLTPLGEEALSGKIPLRLYDAMGDLLSFDLMSRVLTSFRDGKSLKTILTNSNHVSEKEKLRCHVLWLYKYGLIDSRECHGGK